MRGSPDRDHLAKRFEILLLRRISPEPVETLSLLVEKRQVKVTFSKVAVKAFDKLHHITQDTRMIFKKTKKQYLWKSTHLSIFTGIMHDYSFVSHQKLCITELLNCVITDLFEQLHLYYFFAGFIQITAPDTVGYNSFANIKCTTPEKLDYVNWYIQKNAQTQSITNGTEANVLQDLLSSTVLINKTSEVWKGRLFPKELIYFSGLFVLCFVFSYGKILYFF